MALIKSKVIFTSLLILVALSGVSAGETVHKAGDSRMGEARISTKTFHVGDSFVFLYNKDFNNVSEVTPNDFKLCDFSKPLGIYETGSDTVTLTKPGFHHFICIVSGHCERLQILVLPASLGPVTAPVPGPARSPSSSSSSPSRQISLGPVTAPVPAHQNGYVNRPLYSYNAASVVSHIVWIGNTSFVPLLFLFILL